MSNPIKLYNFPKSGHAHRIELMLSLLNLPTELVFVDLAKGAHKQPDFFWPSTRSARSRLSMTTAR